MARWWRRMRRPRPVPDADGVVSDAALRLATCVAKADPIGLEALAIEAPERFCTAVRDRYRSIPGERDQLSWVRPVLDGAAQQ